MRENELDEFRQKQIERWMLWGVHALVYLMFLGLCVTSPALISQGAGVVVAAVWLGALVLHAIHAGAAASRDQQIADAVRQLRLELDGTPPDGIAPDWADSASQEAL